MVNNFSTLVERIKKDGKSLPGGILKVGRRSLTAALTLTATTRS